MPIMVVDPVLLSAAPGLPTTVYQSSVIVSLAVHCEGQGFQAISFDGEQAVVNSQWLE